jgi:hypothetical protein
MAVDYEALALEMGGTIVPDVDYEALALEMGGTVMPVDEVVAPQEFPGSEQFGGMESAVEIPGLDPNIGPEGQYIEPPAQRPEPTLQDTLKGIDETILAIGTGATTGAGGMVRGTLTQLAQEISSGQFGTPEAAKRIEEAAMKSAAEYTYQPRTQEGQQMTQAVGEFAGRYLAPLAGATGELAAAGQAARQAGPIMPTTAAGAPGGMGVRPGPEAPATQGGMGVRPAPRPEEMTIPQQMAATRQQATSARAAKLAEEPYNIENAPVFIQGPKGSEKIIPDKLAENYIRQGGKPGVVAAIKAGSDADRRAALQMVDVYKAGKTDEKKRALLRPTDVIGRTIDERVKFLVDSAKKSGEEIDSIAKGVMKKQPVDYQPAIDDFEAALDELGIKTMDITKGGVKKRVVNLKGSDVEGDTGAKRILNTVFERMYETDAPLNAFDVHRLKRYLDTQINYGPRRANALTIEAERAIKVLRRGLNDAMGDKFPDYRAANTQYSDSIGALNDLQKSVGSQIDLKSANADKSLGTASRKLLSNYSSRVSLMDSLDLAEQVAARYGLKIKDSVINQVIVANELDRMFGTTADTSLKGIMQNVERGVDIARSDALTAALKIAKEGIDKSRGINEENAVAALEELLRRQTELNVYERPQQ